MHGFNFFPAYKQFYKTDAEFLDEKEDGNACDGHCDIADECAFYDAESVSGSDFKWSARDDRKQYLQDDHAHEGEYAKDAFFVDPYLEFLRLGNELYERSANVISQCADENDCEDCKN